MPRERSRPTALATVAILGVGVQGRSHAEAMRAVLGDVELRTWSRRDGGTPEEALRDAQVVCTCTSAREPILRREWLAPGAHVNAVGSSQPSVRELDADTVAEATLFVDRRESAVNEAGDLLLAGFGAERIDGRARRGADGSHQAVRGRTS